MTTLPQQTAFLTSPRASSPEQGTPKILQCPEQAEITISHLIPVAPAKSRDLATRLTAAEKQQLLQWLEQHTYLQVIELAAQPAPIGLGKQLTRSTLSRFYRKHSLHLNRRRRLHAIQQTILPTLPQQEMERLTASLLMEQLFTLTSEPLENLQELKQAATVFAKLSNASLQRDKLDLKKGIHHPPEPDLEQIAAAHDQLNRLQPPPIELEDDPATDESSPSEIPPISERSENPAHSSGSPETTQTFVELEPSCLQPNLTSMGCGPLAPTYSQDDRLPQSVPSTSLESGQPPVSVQDMTVNIHSPEQVMATSSQLFPSNAKFPQCNNEVFPNLGDSMATEECLNPSTIEFKPVSMPQMVYKTCERNWT